MTFEVLFKEKRSAYIKLLKELKNDVTMPSSGRRLLKIRPSTIPNSYSYIYDLVDKIVEYEGLNLLGIQSGKEKEIRKAISSRFHPSQKQLIDFDTFSLFTECQEFLKNDFYFFSQRAIKVKTGSYWLAHQYTIPYSFSAKGIMRAYESRIYLIKKYGGEPYRSSVGISLGAKVNNNQRNIITSRFHKIKAESISFMEPDHAKRAVLLNLLLDISAPDIVDKLGGNVGKIGYYKKVLVKRMRKFFPDWDSIFNQESTIRYLQEMFNYTKEYRSDNSQLYLFK